MTTHAVAPIAKVCGWCNQPASEADRLLVESGSSKSHGLCPSCALKFFPRANRRGRMSRLSRQLSRLADELEQEQARHAEVIRRLTAQDRDPFEIVPGERILASFDDVSTRTEINCPACKGAGYVYVPGCDCRQTPEGCVHPERDVLCERCEGTGDAT